MDERIGCEVEGFRPSASHAAWALDRALRQLSERHAEITVMHAPVVQPDEPKGSN